MSEDADLDTAWERRRTKQRAEFERLKEVEKRRVEEEKRVHQLEALAVNANPILDKLAYNGYHMKVCLTNRPHVSEFMSWNGAFLNMDYGLNGVIPGVDQLVLMFNRQHGMTLELLVIQDDAGVVLWTSPAK